MFEKDTRTKEYMGNNERFADVFNFLLYDGEQVIIPENLIPMDTTLTAHPHNRKSKSYDIQRVRDILKEVMIMEDGETVYLLLGIENQSLIHYAMPVRNMLYDSLQYNKQVQDKAKEKCKNRKKSIPAGEYLSGLSKGDTIKPVVTLVIYFGSKKWDAPVTLHEMLNVKNEKLLKYIPDYRINLITPEGIKKEDFAKFRTELGLVLKYIKYSNDEEELEDNIRNDPQYQNVSRDTAELVNALTDSKIEFNEREEKVNMCKGIEGLIKRGEEIGALKFNLSLVEDGTFTMEQAAKKMNMTVEQFEEKIAALKAEMESTAESTKV